MRWNYVRFQYIISSFRSGLARWSPLNVLWINLWWLCNSRLANNGIFLIFFFLWLIIWRILNVLLLRTVTLTLVRLCQDRPPHVIFSGIVKRNCARSYHLYLKTPIFILKQQRYWSVVRVFAESFLVLFEFCKNCSKKTTFFANFN